MVAANCNGIQIEYESYGEGQPLLLVMGLSSQLVMWPMEWVNLLVEQGFRVIRFDNRDIGLSTKMPGEPPSYRRLFGALLTRRLAKSNYLLSDMADDTAALLDHLGIDRAHVVGASMGGMIAQCLTIQHRDRVASLTSMMSNTGDRKHGQPHPKLFPMALRTRVRSREEALEKLMITWRSIAGPHFEEAAIRQLLEESLARNLDVAATARQAMAIAASPDRTEALGKVTAPTVVIHGLVDPLVMPSGGIATARAIPGSRLLMFPDMGHDLPRNRWGEIIEAIVANAERGGFKRR